MIYQFTKGSRVSGASAQEIGETLEKVRKKVGMVQTEAILKEAQKKTSPIHNCFEWNDKKAGHEYRLWQSRKLIKAVVRIDDEGNEEPAYVHIKSDSLNYYQSTAVAVQNVDEWTLVRNAAMRSLISASEAVDRLDAVAFRNQHKNRDSVSLIKQKVSEAKEEMANL